MFRGLRVLIFYEKNPLKVGPKKDKRGPKSVMATGHPSDVNSKQQINFLN